MADIGGALTAPIATLIGAIVALSGGIAIGLLTVWHQRSLERDKAGNARADALARELAGAVQQLVINIASALHSMCWLTWLAAARPDQLTQSKIDKYDDEQHETLPRILAYLATTAALDMKLHDELRKTVDEVFDLDSEIGRAGLNFRDDAAGTARTLATYYEKMRDLERNLPRSLGDVVGTRLRAP